MRIIVDNKIPYIKGVLEGVADVKYMQGSAISNSDVKDVDAMIIRTRTKCNQQLLTGSSVKFIATATIGYDHIDTEYCADNGIVWTNAPGCNSSSVEQYIVSTLLWLGIEKHIDLAKSTIGIIGAGNVGSKVARAASALGLNVLLNDPPRERAEGSNDFTDLDVLLKESDIVTMHVPLNRSGVDKTELMADASFFSKMKQGAVFINSSRGEVVQESDLKDAIRQDKFSGIVLDVFQNEPAIDTELLKSCTLATPHIAGYSADGKANGTTMSVQALSRFFKLGINDWEADNVPMNGEKEMFADGSEEDSLELISSIYWQTYNIKADQERFLADPGKFEHLRGSYPVRREPAAYSVRLYNDDGFYRKVFEGLGFNVIGDSCF